MRPFAARHIPLALSIAALSGVATASAAAPDSLGRRTDSLARARPAASEVRSEREPGWHETPGSLWATGGLGTAWSNVTDVKQPKTVRFGLTLRRDVERFAVDWTRYESPRLGVIAGETVDMIELTYGRAFEGRAGFVAISTGIGYLGGTRRGPVVGSDPDWSGAVHDEVDLSSFAIPLRAEACLVKGFGDPGSDELWWIGAMSVYGSANFSTYGVVYTIGWALHVGLF